MASPAQSASDKSKNAEDPFLKVFRAELDCIRKRREHANAKRPSLALDREADTRRPATRYGLVGLALSGGGIRSSAVCLGAMQALATREINVMSRVDYLSTVSGGGYIGAAAAAGMAEENGAFPFPSELGGAENRNLKKIRDFSNFLLVGGVSKTLRSFGSIAAGLMSNVLAVVPIVLICAALTIFANPTRDDLRRSLPLFAPIDFMGLDRHFSYSINLLTIAAVIAVILVFVTASTWNRGRVARERLRGVWIVLFTVPLVVAALEFQPFAIRHYWILMQSLSDSAFAQTSQAFCNANPIRCMSDAILPTLTVISGVMAAFSALFGMAARDGKGSSGWRSALARLRGRLIYLAAGLAVPLTIWIVYLTLSRWGIAEYVSPAGKVVCDHTQDLAFGGPNWLDGGLCIAAENLPWKYAPAGQIYLFIGLLGVLLWYFTPPNAYSLHSLYRDKVGNAFLRYFGPLTSQGKPKQLDLSVSKLSDLKTEFAPYHLLNATLNIHGSRKANERGRNGDFFIFSKCFIGSRLTGWCPTKDVESFARSLDLGTAVTVSGAAVSANVGANVNRATVFSLAMLNIRLGYWLVNPFKLTPRFEGWLAKSWGPLWFLREAFGMLTEESRLVFLTDGGHIENLGVYELLRRRCRTIIVIDAEADPEMVMPSFVQLLRFVRIDLGIRIDIDTSEICRSSLAYDSSRFNRGPHAAIGIIHYEDDSAGEAGEKGILIYVKSSLTGDENDYVREYRRRYSSFPQEGTLDQFFSEEQFEAYRALGFHMVHQLFSGDDAFQGLTEGRDGFVTLAERLIREDLACSRPLVWSGRSAAAA